MRKLGSRMAKALLPLFFLALALYPTGAAAKGGTALVVSGAAGEPGDNVEITVSLRGIENLAGVGGLSGGEFEIHYDPAAASIEKIKKGSALGSGFMFMENKKFSESSAKITLAAVSGLITKDGDLCNITFALKKTGPLEVTLKDIAFYDQDVRALAVGATSELPGDSPPGEGPPPGNGGGNEVVLQPPGEPAPSGKKPDDPDIPGTPAGEPGDADIEAPPEEEPDGADPASPGKETSPERPAGSIPGWLFPAAAAAVIAVAGTVFFLYQAGLKKRQKSGPDL